MNIAISQATTMAHSLEEDLEAFAKAQWPGLELWITKIENYLKNHSVQHLKDLLDSYPIQKIAASYQGGILQINQESQKLHLEQFRQRLEMCQALQIPLLTIIGDLSTNPGYIPQEKDSERFLLNLKQSARWADSFGIRLGLEFRTRDPFCSCLETALSLVEACGEKNVGVVLDLFHFMNGPSKFSDLYQGDVNKIYLVQVCDMSSMPREFSRDSDRILPGDGNYPITELMQSLKDTGYQNWVSLELFNPVLAQMKASQVAELGYMSLQRMLPK